MCKLDFDKIAYRDRPRIALERAKAGGVDREFAVAYTALAQGETGYLFLRSRQTPYGLGCTIETKTECANPDDVAVCCGTAVGVENQNNMAPVLAQAPLMNEFLVSRGWLQVDENGLIKPANGFGNPFQMDKAAWAFEYAVATREKAALRLFSIGPTQRHMAYFQSGRCGWPSTWEELWDQYVAGADVSVPSSTVDPGGVAELVMTKRVTHTYLVSGQYLRHQKDGGCVKDNVPYPNGSQSDIAWLTYHAGNTVFAKAVYEGNPELLGSRRPYREVWPEVNAIAATIW